MIVKIKRYRMVIPQFSFFFTDVTGDWVIWHGPANEPNGATVGKSLSDVPTEDHAKITTRSDDLLLTVISWRKAKLLTCKK